MTSNSTSTSSDRPYPFAPHAGNGFAKKGLSGMNLEILNQMWEENREFQKAIVVNLQSLSEEEKVKLTKETALHIVTEINELLTATGKWKKVLQEESLPSKAGIAEELIDIFKFIVNIGIFWEVTPEDFVNEFIRKSQVNWQKFRQATLPLSKDERIVILDLDGVLALYPEHWVDFLKNHIPDNFSFSMDYSSGDLQNLAPNIPRKIYNDVKHLYRESGEKMKIGAMLDAGTFTESLKDTGFKVVILTRRPVNKYKRIYADTIYWLRHRDIHFDGIYWSEGEKANEILMKFPNTEFIVEDDPEQAKDLVLHGIRTFLLDRPYNKDLSDSNLLTRVHSLKEIMYLIAEEKRRELEY